MAKNVLACKSAEEFRAWLEENAGTASECWLELKRGRPSEEGIFYYLDAVEQALCFGWIDSTLGMVEGRRLQRFTPRANNSLWTELNKERVRRLERLGFMTDAGRRILPDMGFVIDSAVEKDIREAGVWDNFIAFPPLYQRIRAYNLAFTKKKTPAEYAKAFGNFVEKTKKGEMYGEWNDYGRLL